MTVYRRGPRPADNFALIANEILQDSRLSFRARGIAASILSRPEGWKTDATTLSRQGKEGREALRAAMRELEDCGYTCLIRTQGEGGHWRSDRYLFDSKAAMQEFLAEHEESARLKPVP